MRIANKVTAYFIDWDYCKYPDGMHVDNGSFCSQRKRYDF